ncbi:MAG: SDR family oxidoreductase [Pseudomonadota bacterium]
MTLQGQRILVTGAANGIGRATAAELAARGASVATFDRDPCPGASHHSVGDVSVEADVVRGIKDAAGALGGLDCLVNNAGIVLEKPLFETTAEDFDRIIAVNLRGVFLMAREVARHFQSGPRSSPGRIINLASELAHLGRAEYSAYCASKGGVVSLTRSLARELAPAVLVNAVAPGPTDTAMLQSERQYEMLKATAEGIPLGRLGEAQEVARAIAFLASDDATFMTGAVLDVNGGAVMA